MTPPFFSLGVIRRIYGNIHERFSGDLASRAGLHYTQLLFTWLHRQKVNEAH